MSDSRSLHYMYPSVYTLHLVSLPIVASSFPTRGRHANVQNTSMCPPRDTITTEKLSDLLVQEYASERPPPVEACSLQNGLTSDQSVRPSPALLT